MGLKNSNIKSAEMYAADSYSESGIYLNLDENGIENLFLVNKPEIVVYWFGTSKGDIQILKETLSETQPQNEVCLASEQGISEDLFLKTLSIISMNDKYKEL